AERTLSFFDVFTTPVARIDSNLTRESRFTAIRSSADPSEGLGLARLSTIYRFGQEPQDFTQGGQNDAFLIDVTQVFGPTLPPILYGFAEDEGDFYEIFFSLSNIQTPSTVVLPFDQFRTRAGGSGTTSFENVARISFSVTGNGTINGILEQGWTVEIDRIRVGRIPEPSTFLLASLATARLSTRRCLCVPAIV
ncbi:MAG: hypothetical protein RID07_15355, partial [Lacipirellulaceae bacterium]